MLVRRATPADRDAVFAVHDAAFATRDGAPAAEATLVDALAADGDVIAALALVAVVEGEVVGHVVGSRARLGDRASMGVGPLGVLPAHHGRGVGSALVHAVLGAADALDLPEAVLLGDPRFYRRFGFEAAAPLGVLAPDEGWGEHFQLRRLSAWDGARGAFRYAPAFDAV